MRKINRMEICKFLEDMKSKACKGKGGIIQSLSFLQEHTFVHLAETNSSGQKSSQHSGNIKEEQYESHADDVVIDKCMKMFLSTDTHGQFLKADIVAHYDYFMNTLCLSHPGRNLNPCEEANIAQFPALTYTPEENVQDEGSFQGEVILESNQEDDEDDGLIDID